MRGKILVSLEKEKNQRKIYKKNKKVLAFLKLLVYNTFRVKELKQLKNT